MQAIILAAGNGRRLGEPAGPKCLLEIGGRPLIEHQLEALAAVGVRRPVLVVGYQHGMVRDVVGDRAVYVRNPRYRTTNSLYSFHLARDGVDGDAFVLNADVLFPAHVLVLLALQRSSALAYDSTSGGDPEHMKVRFWKGGRLLEAGKDLPADQSHGESLGLVLLRHQALRRAFAVADAFVTSGATDAWFPAALSEVARLHPVQGVDVSDVPWIEIDFPDDLERARAVTWPALAASTQRRFAVCDLRRQKLEEGMSR